MFNKDAFLGHHAINVRTGFDYRNNSYDGYVTDANGKQWGWIKSLNLYEQAETGIRKDPAQFQLMNIDIIGYGSNDGDTSNRPTGSPYMYDPQGVAAQMYSGDANVLILGDSIHNFNNTYNPVAETGYQPLIGSYIRKWQPERWSGMGVPQTFGSSAVSARTNTTVGTRMTGSTYKPGENSNILYRHYTTTNSLFIEGITVDNPNTTWSSTNNAEYKISATNFSFPQNTTFLPGERLDSGQLYVGRNQVFEDLDGGTASTCWFNTVGQPLRYSHTVYVDIVDGIDAIHARATDFETPQSAAFLDEYGLTAGEYNTIVLDSPTPTEDELHSADLSTFNLQAAGIGPLGISSRLANCWTRVYNPAVENGMELTYAGSGGWEFANHGATQASDAPTTEGITSPWYNDDAITRMMTDFETNIVYVYLTNAAAGGVEADRIGLRNIVSRVNSNYASTGLGGTVKIVFVAPHPNHGSDDAGLARRNMILEECRSLGVGYIDLYGYLKDNGVTESTVKDTYGYLVDTFHPGSTGADYFAEKIWDIITQQVG